MKRIFSGVQPTQNVHLGNYLGAIRNWVRLQDEYDCIYCVVDLHALTTAYESVEDIRRSAREMVADWIAVGVDPERSIVFRQSDVHEHAELLALLGMVTPLSWLERVPTYKGQIAELGEGIDTYGFLGYPLLQAADVLIYRASQVPVGDDQVPHIEMMREIARRFNHLYGKEKDFEEKAAVAVKKLGSKRAKLYLELRTEYQQEGKDEALDQATIFQFGATVDLGWSVFEDVLVTLETTELDPEAREFKYYAPLVGLIRVEEGLSPDLDDPELVVDLLAPVPLPAALPLLAASLASLVLFGRRRA